MRDLYEMFRDSVIEDAIKGSGTAIFKSTGGRTAISAWKLIPPDKTLRRDMMMALLRRFMTKAAEEYPDGFCFDAAGFWLSPVFIEFARTHRELGTDPKTMRRAWLAMRSIPNDQR